MEKFNDEQYTVNETECNEKDITEETDDAVVAETEPLEEEKTEEQAAACAKCGAVLDPAHKFCAVCGEKVEEQVATCGKCGAVLDPGHKFCAVCGEKVEEQAAAVAVAAVEKKKPKMKKGLVIGLIAVLVVAIIFVGVSGAQKNRLHNRLMEGNWWSYEDGTKLYLDFNESDIEYTGDFGILGNCHIATIDYEVVDGDTILVYGSEVEVDMDADSVTFSPSFINTDSYSLWLE